MFPVFIGYADDVSGDQVMTRTTAALLSITVFLALAAFVSLNLYLFTLVDRSTAPVADMTFHGKNLTYKCELVRKVSK